MKLAAVVLLLSSLLAFAKTKDPAIEQRKAFLVRVEQLMEHDGWVVPMVLAGKQKDVLEVWMPDTPVARIRLFAQRYLDPLRKEGEMKTLGFRLIRVKTNYGGATFPDGIWDLPID